MRRTREGWRRPALPPELAGAARSLETLSLSHAYRDQKTALDKLHHRAGTELFVATFALRDDEADPAQVCSYCVLTEGSIASCRGPITSSSTAAPAACIRNG